MATIVVLDNFLEFVVFHINEKSCTSAEEIILLPCSLEFNPIHYKNFLYLQQIAVSHILHVPKQWLFQGYKALPLLWFVCCHYGEDLQMLVRFQFRKTPLQSFEQQKKNTIKHKLVDFLRSISSLVLHVLYNNASKREIVCLVIWIVFVEFGLTRFPLPFCAVWARIIIESCL